VKMATKKPAKTAENKGAMIWVMRSCAHCANEIAAQKDSLRVLSRSYQETRFRDRWTWWHRNCWGK